MSISKIMAFVFGIAFIVFLYGIIYYSLKIMYKDVKTGGKKKSNPAARKYAVEVINPGASEDLEEGSVILVRTELTIGRREDNLIVLSEPFASGYHAKLYVKNNNLYIQDLNSTNGVYVNDERIKDKARLTADDEIKIGSAIFKVLKPGKQ